MLLAHRHIARHFYHNGIYQVSFELSFYAFIQFSCQADSKVGVCSIKHQRDVRVFLTFYFIFYFFDIKVLFLLDFQIIDSFLLS